MTRTARIVNPKWEDKDYGYVKVDTYYEDLTYTYTRRGMQGIYGLHCPEDMAWRLEYLTQQFLEYARIKQVCLAGMSHYECDEERGGECCRQCLELSADDWSPLSFD